MPGAVVATEHGLATALTHWRPPVSYCAFTEPARSAVDFEMRVAAALTQGARTTAPWYLAILVAWFDAVRDGPILAAMGFRRAASAFGLSTQSLAAPRHSLPELTVRRARDREELAPLVTINNRVYGAEPEHADDLYLQYVLTPGSCAMIGYVGDDAVTCAAAFPTAYGTYLGGVATDARWRGRGYAEAICRRTLALSMAETAQQRAVLFASPNRSAYYESMGFSVGAEWLLFRLPE
ncbi:MAG TPA: GNAT family N-acetyltransferase [Gemmatimonadaceae bacterium]|nr:GNAT family N-acetyltransferase [Gemmatimonadaceae bacterium]